MLDGTMSARIYVAVDYREPAQEPMDLARVLASASGAPVTVASVYAFQPLTSRIEESTYGQALRAEAEPVVQRLADALRAQGVEATGEAVADVSVARGLNAVSERADAGVLVVGSTTRGPAGRILSGTTATHLLHGAACAVAVAPRAFEAPAQAPLTIGVGYNGSADADVALAEAADYARVTGARLRMLAAADLSSWIQPVGVASFDYGQLMRGQVQALERAVRKAVDALPGDVAVEHAIREGDAAKVLAEASDDLDLLVCGSRGYGAIRGALLGSVSRRLVQAARCPVVVVPRDAREGGRSLSALVNERAARPEPDPARG
jgi:nucleotide-binding universal stress UspA family protein